MKLRDRLAWIVNGYSPDLRTMLDAFLLAGILCLPLLLGACSTVSQPPPTISLPPIPSELQKPPKPFPAFPSAKQP